MSYLQSLDLFSSLMLLLTLALGVAGITRNWKMPGHETDPNTHEQVLLFGTMEALDGAVGDGQLLYQRNQPQEGRIQGVYPTVTIVPVEGPPFLAAVMPQVFDILCYISSGGGEEE